MKKFTAVLLACLLLISTLSAVCYAVSESDFYGADDKPFFSEKYLGTVESGYPLYYFETPSPPWMCEFSHQYGDYIITNYNGNAEKDNGFYLKNEDERIYLSEAFEKGWTDIEEVVSLTKENAPELYNYRIFSVKDAEKLVKERYNDNINLEYVGIIYAGYYLFYENDLEKALVEWELDFQFGDYAFHAFGGHTGNVEPEALGLYVMNDGKILNIKEAYEQIPASEFCDDLYDLVNIIKSKELNYSFTVSRKSDIKETTEPIETTVTATPAEIPTTEPGGTTSPASSTAQTATEASETAFTEPAEPVKEHTPSYLYRALKLKAGKTAVLNVSGASLTTSNKKVALVKNGKVTALKKGTADITAVVGNIKYIYKTEVVNNPSISKKSISVKKGKTKSVKLIGKAKPVNNKYTNTKTAKIISKRSADKIKIRGLKRGKTTLKIFVNGYKLKLKVKVK